MEVESEIKLVAPVKVKKAKPKKKYVCNLCGAEYKSNMSLYMHMPVHLDEKRFKCDLCGTEFTHKSSLTMHMKIHSGERDLICNVCGKLFYKSSNLKEHMRTHSGEKPYVCNVCNKRFALSSNLTSHLRVHSGERPYICNICNKGFKESGQLKRHLRVHSGEKPYQCSICNKRFSKSCSLGEHKRRHMGEKPHKCVICDKAFTDSSSRNRHVKVHLKHQLQQQFSEQVVNDAESAVGEHSIAKSTKNLESIFETPALSEIVAESLRELGKAVAAKNLQTIDMPVDNVLEHIPIETESIITEERLPSEYSQEEEEIDPNDHSYQEKIITDEDVNDMRTCNKRYALSLKPTSHLRVHSGEWPFTCNICNKGFKVSGQLKRHLRVHSGEKPYQCSICNKRFSKSCYLGEHKRRHLGEKPHKCTICDKAFTDSSSRNRHVKVHLKYQLQQQLSEQAVNDAENTVGEQSIAESTENTDMESMFETHTLSKIVADSLRGLGKAIATKNLQTTEMPIDNIMESIIITEQIPCENSQEESDLDDNSFRIIADEDVKVKLEEISNSEEEHDPFDDDSHDPIVFIKVEDDPLLSKNDETDQL